MGECAQKLIGSESFTTTADFGDFYSISIGSDVQDLDNICPDYQTFMACYPACFCKVDSTIATVKKLTEDFADVGVECKITCGEGPPAAVPAPATLSAANPSTIGFTSVALIVAALFATL